MAHPTLANEALKVLFELRESALDGYSLLAKTGLKKDVLIKALSELLAQKIVIVKGELAEERIGDTYVSVRPSARGYADMMLQFKLP